MAKKQLRQGEPVHAVLLLGGSHTCQCEPSMHVCVSLCLTRRACAIRSGSEMGGGVRRMMDPMPCCCACFTMASRFCVYSARGTCCRALHPDAPRSGGPVDAC